MLHQEQSGITARCARGEFRPSAPGAAGVDRGYCPGYTFALVCTLDLHHTKPCIAPESQIRRRYPGIIAMFAPQRISQAPGAGSPALQADSPFLVQITTLISTHLYISISNGTILTVPVDILVCTFSEIPVQTWCKGAPD